MSCLLDCKCNSSWCRMRRWFITTLHVHPFLQLGKSRFKSWICSSTCAERACLNNRNSLHILVFWGPQAQKLRKGELGKQTSKFEVGCGHAFSQPSIKSERGRTGHSCFFFQVDLILSAESLLRETGHLKSWLSKRAQGKRAQGRSMPASPWDTDLKGSSKRRKCSGGAKHKAVPLDFLVMFKNVRRIFEVSNPWIIWTWAFGFGASVSSAELSTPAL